MRSLHSPPIVSQALKNKGLTFQTFDVTKMKTLEDKSTDLSVKKLVCGAGGKCARSSVGVRVCFFCECQNKETVQ